MPARRLQQSLAMEIKQTNTLTEAEQEKLFGWGEDIFNVNPLTLQWRHKDLRFVGFDNEEPVGKIVSPLQVMVIPFGNRAWPAGTIELQSLPW